MSRLNHAKLAHRGRNTEMAFAPRPKWNPNDRAKAASTGHSLSPEAVAAWAAQHGIAVSAGR